METTTQIVASEPRNWSRQSHRLQPVRASKAVTPTERRFAEILDMYGEEELDQWTDDTKGGLSTLTGSTILAIHQSRS